jgi:hypothetical protein
VARGGPSENTWVRDHGDLTMWARDIRGVLKEV